MSLASTSSSTEAKRTWSGRSLGARLLTITSRPNPLAAMSAMWRPTAPKPIMPIVRPERSLPDAACSRPASQPVSRRSRSTRRNFLSSAIEVQIACSATVRAFAPGTLATSTPALVAASIGIMSRPAPWRIAARNRLARSKSTGGRLARTMTISASRASSASVTASIAVATTRLPWALSKAVARSCSGWVEKMTGFFCLGMSSSEIGCHYASAALPLTCAYKQPGISLNLF